MTVAFVLSGGASLGAVQAGMLEALYERDIEPDLVIGTSAGAINGAFVASRPATVESAHELQEIWRGVRQHEVFPLSPLTGLLGFLGRSDHLVSDRGLRRVLERWLSVNSFQETRIPVHVIATDLLSGTERRLSRGDLVDAVMASAAIPAVFEPVEIGGEELVDGGVANNAPLSHAIELGADLVYVLPTGYACSLERSPRGALAVATHAVSLLVQQRLLREIRDLEDHERLIVLPPPCPLTVQPIDFSHADELIERGRDGARAVLDNLPPRGSAVPETMRGMHDHG